MPRPSPQTERVVRIVNLLTEREERGASLTEIARDVGQTPAACVHVLAALVEAGFVVRQPADRRYHLGPALIEPGRAAARGFPSRDATRAAIEGLARETGYPVLAFRREAGHARLVDVVWDLRRPAPAMRIGDLLPIQPPLGTVFVAWNGPAALEEWLRGSPADTADRLRAGIEHARRIGFVLELRPPLPLVQELARLLARGQDLRRAERVRASLSGIEDYLADAVRPGATYEVSTISVPVRGPTGTVDLALNLLGFADSTPGRVVLELGARTTAAADALAAELARTAIEQPGPERHGSGGRPGDEGTRDSGLERGGVPLETGR
jgi:DNA-binding IclR family transcriptional regulator